jgi:hypothetical protein
MPGQTPRRRSGRHPSARQCGDTGGRCEVGIELTAHHPGVSLRTASGASVNLPESNTHSFVVKVWLEETAEEAGGARWRGHVSHVPDGERRYVERLQEVTAFIAPYLLIPAQSHKRAPGKGPGGKFRP